MGIKGYKDGHIFVGRRGRADKEGTDGWLESDIWSWPNLVGTGLLTREGRGNALGLSKFLVRSMFI